MGSKHSDFHHFVERHKSKHHPEQPQTVIIYEEKEKQSILTKVSISKEQSLG